MKNKTKKDIPEVDERKWRKLDRAIEFVLDIAAVLCVQMLCDKYFDGSLKAMLILLVVLLFACGLIKQFLLQFIYRSDSMRSRFEKNET